MFSEGSSVPASQSFCLKNDGCRHGGWRHVVLMSFVFVIGLTERAVLASYTMVVPACLHDQWIEANSQSELVILNWFYNWFSLYTVPHAHS